MSLIEQTCEICGVARGLDRHHVVPRGMGGSRERTVLAEDNLITLCRACHRNIHEGGWVLERSPQLLRVVDGRSGDEIMRRHCDHDFDATAFLDLLSRLDTSLVQAVHLIRYLDDDQLVEAFRAARSLGKRAWLLEAATLYEAQRRSVYGDRALESIARRFEISLRHAQKYALVWRLFFAKEQHDGGRDEGQPFLRVPDGVNVDAFFLEEPSWYVAAATESPDPVRWLAYAQDKKAENPRYSISDFRGEIQQAAGADIGILEERTPQSPGPRTRIAWDCPWVKPYCTRSGKPVLAEDCRCEAVL